MSLAQVMSPVQVFSPSNSPRPAEPMETEIASDNSTECDSTGIGGTKSVSTEIAESSGTVSDSTDIGGAKSGITAPSDTVSGGGDTVSKPSKPKRAAAGIKRAGEPSVADNKRLKPSSAESKLLKQKLSGDVDKKLSGGVDKKQQLQVMLNKLQEKKELLIASMAGRKLKKTAAVQDEQTPSPRPASGTASVDDSASDGAGGCRASPCPEPTLNQLLSEAKLGDLAAWDINRKKLDVSFIDFWVFVGPT